MSEQQTTERAKHTPGPWKAIGTKVFGLENIVAINQDHPRHYIATVPRATDCSPPGNPDQEANARLIASSPDMLEALRTAEDALKWYGNVDRVAANAVQKIRAALAKAKGTTE